MTTEITPSVRDYAAQGYRGTLRTAFCADCRRETKIERMALADGGALLCGKCAREERE